MKNENNVVFEKKNLNSLLTIWDSKNISFYLICKTIKPVKLFYTLYLI